MKSTRRENLQDKSIFCIRSAAADTFAMVVFSFFVGMLIEIFISGMSFEQSLTSRLVATPVNIASAYPYGLYRDFIVNFILRRSDSKWLKHFADTFAYVSFQSPVYLLILISVGASTEQIVTALISNALVSCCIGFVYGQFLEVCRRLFRVPKPSLQLSI